MISSIFTRLQLWSALLGNFFEHYESALFGFLAPFLAPLIFPSHEPIVALILTYGMIPLGMLARPFGAIVFGRIGDLYGRRQALFLSLGGMALISAGIAISPTFDQIGITAAVIFCLSRIGQNFLSAGESMGGAIFLMENTQEGKHDLLSGFYNATTIGGVIFASFGVSILIEYGIIDHGWRFLYILGCFTAVFGCLIRRKLPENFEMKAKLNHAFSIRNFLTVIWRYRQALFLIALSAGFSYANYSIALVLMNGFIPLITEYSKEQMIQLNTFLLVLDFAALPFFGWLASKVSRERMMLGAALGVVFMTIPLFFLLEHATLTNVVIFRIFLVLFGVAFFAPFHAWTPTLVPEEHRYTVISFGYAIGSQLFGGPTAAVSLWLYKQTGIPSSVSWYWLALAIITSCALSRKLLLNEKKLEFLV